MLVVGGDVSRVAPFTGLVGWDGQEWVDLGARLDTPIIDAVLPVGEALYIGGQFLTVGGSQGSGAFVARLDAGGWRTLPWYAAPVKALATFNGEVVAGGTLAWLQPTPARWTGSAWEPLGGGVNQDVLALAEFDGSLVAGGQFTSAGGVDALRVARWNGQAWIAMGAGFNNTVEQLVVHEGRVYARGTFTQSGSTLVNGLAVWNGLAWVSVGTPPGRAMSILADADGLLALFSIVGPGMWPIQRWTGSAWQPVAPQAATEPGTGFESLRGPLARWGEAIVAGAPGLVAWDGKEWSPLDGGSRTLLTIPRSMIEHEGRVLLAGTLRQAGITPGYDQAGGILAWDGARFEAFTTPPGPRDVRRLIADGGDVVAVGRHVWSGQGDTVAARWNGVAWSPMGAAAPAMVEFAVGDAVMVGESLYVLGGSAGGASGVLDATGPTLEAVGGVQVEGGKDLAIHQGELVAACDSGLIPGMTSGFANGVIAWNGSQWRVLGDSGVFASPVVSLVSFNGLLVAAGATHTGGEVASWDGSTWTVMGDLPGVPSRVVSLHGTLYALGLAVDCSPIGSCGAIATWDGSSWVFRVLGESSGAVNAVEFGDEAFFTGSFSRELTGGTRSVYSVLGTPPARPCPADVTTGAIPGRPGFGHPDGIATNDDLFYYVVQFAEGNILVADLTSTSEPTHPCYGRPDGVINNDDFFYFLAAFAAGC